MNLSSMDITDDDSDFILYNVNQYFNSDKEPLSLTFKGKAKEYKLAHETIKKWLKKGAEIILSNGKLKVVDLPFKKAMTNAIVEVEITSENIANVEMKVYEPSSKKNKAATIELRKLPGSEYEHVEKLKDILSKLIDDIIAGKDPLKGFKRNCLKSMLNNISSNPKKFICPVCSWESKLSSSLKTHMTKLL